MSSVLSLPRRLLPAVDVLWNICSRCTAYILCGQKDCKGRDVADVSGSVLLFLLLRFSDVDGRNANNLLLHTSALMCDVNSCCRLWQIDIFSREAAALAKPGLFRRVWAQVSALMSSFSNHRLIHLRRAVDQSLLCLVSSVGRSQGPTWSTWFPGSAWTQRWLWTEWTLLACWSSAHVN